MGSTTSRSGYRRTRLVTATRFCSSPT
ncbi:hypothetical protein EYF80_068197 [Liparis tanakae]|uniref:Uncharacterized protein n=1 Tax=Liparis tanakae TaxID=230148 RepID=A0A4Z2DYQ4_9TELE|nr:hypothetical protein EYF80_068197 [Liparis tanakae]